MNARKHGVTPLVLTDREVVKLIPVDRSTTLRELKRSGDLTVVPWGRGTRVTLESVQALARRGWTVGGKPVRAVSRPRRGPPAADVGARILALKVKP